MENKKAAKRKANDDLEVKDDKNDKGEQLNSKKGKKSSNQKSEQSSTEAKAKPTKQATLDKFNILIKSPNNEKEYDKHPSIPKNSNLKICSWNVNGLRATISKGSIDKFIKQEMPDIFCLNETKIDIDTLKKDKLDKIYSEDYLSFWNCCKIKSGYSGVAVFSKYRPVNVTYDIEGHDKEGRVITVEYEDFFLIAVYVPNAGEGLKRLDYRVKEWDVAFANYLNSLKEKKDVILCGDLNVAHKEIDVWQTKGAHKTPGFTPEERESFSKFLEVGYVDTFRHLKPEEVKFSYFSARRKTHREENKGWRLDYFVINENAIDRLVNSEILYEYEGSDHIPIRLSWKA